MAAVTKLALGLLLIAMLLVADVKAAGESFSDAKVVDMLRNKGGRMMPQSCAPACGHRCSQTQYMKPCLKYCNLCCQKCLCVPPGFYGNKQVCPCYNNMKNAKGGPKCP